MDRRDELDEGDDLPAEDLEGRGEDDLRDWSAGPAALVVGGRMTLEERPQVDWSHSGTRTARWLSVYGPMSMPRASSRSCCIAANPR